MMVYNQIPFNTATCKDKLYDMIAKDLPHMFWKYHPSKQITKDLPDDLKSLIISMLSLDPTRRPTIEEIS